MTELMEHLQEAQSKITQALGNPISETEMSSLLQLNDEILAMQAAFSSLQKGVAYSPAPPPASKPKSSPHSADIGDLLTPALPPPRQLSVQPNTTAEPKGLSLGMSELSLLEPKKESTTSQPRQLDEFDLIARRASSATPLTLPLPFVPPKSATGGGAPPPSIPSFVPDFSNNPQSPSLPQPIPLAAPSTVYNATSPSPFNATTPSISSTATNQLPWITYSLGAPSQPLALPSAVPTQPTPFAPWDPFSNSSQQQTTPGFGCPPSYYFLKLSHYFPAPMFDPFALTSTSVQQAPLPTPALPILPPKPKTAENNGQKSLLFF